MNRRGAIKTLNVLAEKYGVKTIKNIAKAAAKDVQRLLKALQRRRLPLEDANQLRETARTWSDNGGELDGQVVPPQVAPVEHDEPAVGEATAAPLGNPAALLQKHKVLVSGYRLQSRAFMLTYNGDAICPDAWEEFRDFIKELATEMGATKWAACIEESLHATTPQRGPDGDEHEEPKFHAHAYFFWDGFDGVALRDTSRFCFDGILPRVDACFMKNPAAFKRAAHHGLWYVYVKKLGTVLADTNCFPWSDYVPQGQWLARLWEARKVSHEQFEQMSAEFRHGHAGRMRDLAEVRRTEATTLVRAHVAHEAAVLATHVPLLPARRDILVVERFVAMFEEGAYYRRRPILVIVGPTGVGKSLLAADVLKRIGGLLGLRGFLEVTVEDDGNLDLADFDLSTHAGVLLDGVGDVHMLVNHREALQGRAKLSTGGRSSTMMYSYKFSLARRAVVATMDLGAKHLPLLKSHHWLKNPENILLAELASPAWVEA